MTSIGLTAGAIESGILISTFLYGIATVQTYIYFRSEYQDQKWMKILVGTVWLLESFLTVLTSMYLYDLTITNFGETNTLQDLPWTMDVSFAVGGLVSALVQSFFAWRVYVISGYWSISSVSWVLCLIRIIVTLTICILDIKSKTVINYERLYPWTITFSLTVAMFIDNYNTCMLCFWLYNLYYRRRDRHQNSKAMVDKILMWTIETGLVTSICEILMLTLYLTRPEQDIWIGILMFYAKLYSNSLLVSLNGRSAIRNNRGRTEGPALSSIRIAPSASVTDITSTDVCMEMGSLAKSRSFGHADI